MTPSSIVLELAKLAGMTPISWHVANDHVTIVFEQGPKIRYETPGGRITTETAESTEKINAERFAAALADAKASTPVIHNPSPAPAKSKSKK